MEKRLAKVAFYLLPLLKTVVNVTDLSHELVIFALIKHLNIMEQQANYIRRIEIKGLWKRFDIAWDLRPDVNILSGINGVGKTTILNRSVGYLEELSGEMKSVAFSRVISR